MDGWMGMAWDGVEGFDKNTIVSALIHASGLYPNVSSHIIPSFQSIR